MPRDLHVGETIPADSPRRLHELLNKLVDGDKVMATFYFPDGDLTTILEAPVTVGPEKEVVRLGVWEGFGSYIRHSFGGFANGLKCVTVSALADEPDPDQEFREKIAAAVMDIQDRLAGVLSVVQECPAPR